MRSPATPPRHKLASALAVAILALALLPMLGGQPAAIAEEACGGAAAEGGSGVPLVADALAGKPTCFVNQVVALDGQAPVLGSFTVDGMTYAVTGEGAVELVAVAPAVLAGGLAAGLAGLPLPAPTAPPPEREPSDSSEDEEASDPVALDVPDLVEHDGATYSVTSIGPRAFVGCDADMVRVSPSVASVDEAAFRGSAVGGVEVAEGSQSLASYEGVLYDAGFNSLLLIPEGKKGVVRIHSNTSVVPQSAFSHCAGVESIEVDAGNESFCVEDGVLYGAEGGNRAPSATVAADARGLSRVETVYIYSMDRQGGTGGTSTVYFKPGSGLTDYWLDAACTTPPGTSLPLWSSVLAMPSGDTSRKRMAAASASHGQMGRCLTLLPTSP